MTDKELRTSALHGVQRLWRRHGDAVPYSAIKEGFLYQGERIPFFSTFEGVFKPAQLHVGALSVRSTIASRYSDERISDDEVWYDYSPKPERNRWLRECAEHRLPLLYFLQVKSEPPVEYLVFAPVEVVEDDPARNRFRLDLSPSRLYEDEPDIYREAPVPDDIHSVFERKYGVTETRIRLFQAHFRRDVLEAYDRRCAVCSLGEGPVLDGAHIVPDSEELGEPRVSNGLSFCPLHHRAYDRDLIGVRPDFTVHVFRGRMDHPEEEHSGVITEFDGEALRIPSEKGLRPDRELVENRWTEAIDG